jgi:hypothetical protein
MSMYPTRISAKMCNIPGDFLIQFCLPLSIVISPSATQPSPNKQNNDTKNNQATDDKAQYGEKPDLLQEFDKLMYKVGEFCYHKRIWCV